MTDVTAATENKCDPLLALLLDAEKAFDRLSWEFLCSVLQSDTILPEFTNWRKIFYNEPYSRVLTNELCSGNFPVAHGSWQGCPLSPPLFDLALELLLRSIQQSEGIKVIKV